MWKSFCEDTGCLLWITAVVNGYQSLFDEFSNPMPLDCNVLALTVELLVLSYGNCHL